MTLHRNVFAGILLALSLVTTAQALPQSVTVHARDGGSHLQVRSADTAELPDEKIQPRVAASAHLLG
ncbi:hypothetical protein ACLEVJ_20520 [Enterobacter ludwigii]|jgi:hypothetical protein|uniref:hypothetical protein n=1 Tax=Enterobacter ludwigii TaxID=299767 RepID=UPI0020731F43